MPTEGFRRAAAFAPAHVTGFFSIHDTDPQMDKRGSKGAGFSLELGATSYVEVSPSDDLDLEIFLDKSPSEAPVTRTACLRVLEEAGRMGKIPLVSSQGRRRPRLRVRVYTTHDLPISQGFGMSAAGALSSALALAKAVGVGRTEAIRAAHESEIRHRTGLGDVVGAVAGGWEIRRLPGLPPWGVIQRFVGPPEVLVSTVSSPIPTRSVLTDPRTRERISPLGERALEALLSRPTAETFVEESYRFARESGLLSGDLLEVVDEVRTLHPSSMVMIGGSLFVLPSGNLKEVEEILSGRGEVWVSRIDERGARTLPIEGENEGR